MAWYVVMLRRLTGSESIQKSLQINYEMGAFGAIISMWIPWIPVHGNGRAVAVVLVIGFGFGLLLAGMW